MAVRVGLLNVEHDQVRWLRFIGEPLEHSVDTCFHIDAWIERNAVRWLMTAVRVLTARPHHAAAVLSSQFIGDLNAMRMG